MAITRGKTGRKRLSASPPPSSPPHKIRAISKAPSDGGIEEVVDVADYVDVEAEHESSSDGRSVAAGAEDDEQDDSSNDWVVPDDAVLSEWDSSDAMSDTDFPSTLTAPRERSTEAGTREGTEEPLLVETIDVKGKSVAVRVPVVDNTDVLMPGDSEDSDALNNSGQTVAQEGDASGSGDADMEGVIPNIPDVAGIVSRAGSLSLGGAQDGTKGVESEKVVADLFVAVKAKRPVRANTPSKEKPAKKKGGATVKKPEPKQAKLALKEKESEFTPDEAFVREDNKPVKGKFLRRLVVFTGFANDNESMYYVRNEPQNLDWSGGKVNVARLVVHGQVTPIRLMVLGQITWNGMLPTGRNDDGPEYPTRPKISIKCLRDADFLHFRGLIKEYSNSRNELELHNMSTLSAYTDVGERKRGSDKLVGVPYSKIYDAEKKYSANKDGMERLRPNQLVRNDIVMLEVSVGHYYDVTGKHPNWSSTRVYFRLEAVSLLLPHDAKSNEDKPKPKPQAGSSALRVVPMDETM